MRGALARASEQALRRPPRGRRRLLRRRQREVIGPARARTARARAPSCGILTGYLRPSSGTVTRRRLRRRAQGRAARRRIGYVPEDAPLYPHMRVNEFLDFMGRLRGLDGAALRGARRRRNASGFALRRARAHHRPAVARLPAARCIAQAVLHEPELLVLDEPTNGLDPRQIIELRGLIRALAQSSIGIVTSHILAEIERVADRVAILLDGRLLHACQPIGQARRLRSRLLASAPRRTLFLAAHHAKAGSR